VKKSEVLAKVMAGERLLVGEYRSSQVEQISFRDKTSGQARSFWRVAHTVEFGNLSVSVSERMPDDFDGSKFVAPGKKGNAVVVHMDGWLVEKGTCRASGKLELLTE